LSIFQLPAVKLLEVLAHYAKLRIQARGRFLHSLTAVSIMFCSRPIQGLTVASWLRKHS